MRIFWTLTGCTPLRMMRHSLLVFKRLWLLWMFLILIMFWRFVSETFWFTLRFFIASYCSWMFWRLICIRKIRMIIAIIIFIPPLLFRFLNLSVFFYMLSFLWYFSIILWICDHQISNQQIFVSFRSDKTVFTQVSSHLIWSSLFNHLNHFLCYFDGRNSDAFM